MGSKLQGRTKATVFHQNLRNPVAAMPRSRSPVRRRSRSNHHAGRNRSRSRSPRKDSYRKKVALVTAAESDVNKQRLLEKARLLQKPRSPERKFSSSSSKAPPATRPDDAPKPSRSPSPGCPSPSRASQKKSLPFGVTRSLVRGKKAKNG